MKYKHFPFEMARTAVLLAFIALAGPGFAQPNPAATDDGARTNSLARLLAGLAPTYPAHAKFAQSKEWKKYSANLEASWQRLDKRQAKPLKAWRDANLPRRCPAGSTLLYPFSGPDFLNANWFFPDCKTIVMFGLEPVGEVPPVESMSEAQFGRLLEGLRDAMSNIFVRNYFITSRMRKNLQAEEVHGVLPVLMISMAFSGVEIVRIAPIVLDPPAASKGRSFSALTGLTIEFRRRGSQSLQQLHYFPVDVANKQLAGYPQFIGYIKGLAPTTTLIKSASYLLHVDTFTKIRTAILKASAFILQDDTGIPYPILAKAGLETRVFGHYVVPISPFESHYQQTLADAFETQKPGSLSFRFGYYKTSVNDDRSNIMIATRARSGAASSNDMAMRSALPRQ